MHLVYCYGQALQTIKAIKIIRGSLDKAFELTKVIKYSCVFEIIGITSNTLQKEKELPAG